MNHAAMLFDYESGLLDDDDFIELFQSLINSGLIWHLQGSHQRTAQTLIESGRITLEDDPHA